MPRYSTSTGWAEVYGRRGVPVTALHTGGPADGHKAQLPRGAPPQARWYATPAARRGRVVVLYRYVLHDRPALNTVSYVYTGLDEVTGPRPGLAESPAWS
jgi:hypothetical protein